MHGSLSKLHNWVHAVLLKIIYKLIYGTDSFFSVQDDDVPVRKVGRVHGERRVGELFCLDICNYLINMLMSLVNICFVLFLAAL